MIGSCWGDLGAGYLSGLPPARAQELARVNAPGLAALEGYLASGQAVAFLGAGLRAQATAVGNTDALAQGRDDADTVRRLAIRHHLPWHELDALRAQAALDDAEGTSHSWAAQAEQLHAQLVPPGLDPNPLATVERLVEDEKAKGDDDGDTDPADPGR